MQQWRWLVGVLFALVLNCAMAETDGDHPPTVDLFSMVVPDTGVQVGDPPYAFSFTVPTGSSGLWLKIAMRAFVTSGCATTTGVVSLCGKVPNASFEGRTFYFSYPTMFSLLSHGSAWSTNSPSGLQCASIYDVNVASSNTTHVTCTGSPYCCDNTGCTFTGISAASLTQNNIGCTSSINGSCTGTALTTSVSQPGSCL